MLTNVASNHCFKIHSSINDATLERVVGRLRGHCQLFGQDFDTQEQVFRTLPGITPPSILHVFHDKINKTWYGSSLSMFDASLFVISA
jgi:hypothetical protein